MAAKRPIKIETTVISGPRALSGLPARFELHIAVTDPTPGWQLGKRLLPSGYKIRVNKYVWFEGDGTLGGDVSESDARAMARGDLDTQDGDRLVGVREWLELDIDSAPEHPPRCVALHTPRGIGTPELRFPLASIVVEASALVASPDGDFGHFREWAPFEYEDNVFEAKHALGRRGTRAPITPDKLEEVGRVARSNPNKPTAAVRRHFKVSRPHARRLIIRAEEAGIDVGR